MHVLAPNDDAGETVGRTLPAFRLRSCLAVAAMAAAAFVVSPIAAQEADEDEEDEEAAEEIELVVVTGTRLARQPSELSRDVIVLDQDAIIASGELTLPRLLRQLPQNINSTNETYGSDLNGATNITGASTVNLRGLGSESTLILVDGRRVGYSGLLGGVTDIASIPLSMVDRIEIITDGASAIYGSDAVGGVVNIITRKDYQGVNVTLDYGRPDKPGYDETRVSVAAGWRMGDVRMIGGVEHFYDSGLDASQRDSDVHLYNIDRTGQKNGLAGPQMRAFSWFFDDSCDADKAVVYRHNGRIITREDYANLSDTAKLSAECHADVTLPAGFQPGNDLNSIMIFGPPNWDNAAEFGTSLRPEQRQNAFNVGGEFDVSELLTLRGNVSFASRETTSNQGLSSISNTLNAGNPYNPFGRAVTIRGQILNAAPRHFASEKEDLRVQLGANGTIGVSGWTWQAEFGSAEEQIDAQRLNVLDGQTISNGMNSDGVTESVIDRISGISAEECDAALADYPGGSRVTYSAFFGGNCTVWGAPPDPINPFGDLSGYISAGLGAASSNEQTQFEAQARGDLFEMPGGAAAVALGYDYRKDVLDTMSEFHSATGTCSGISCPNESPVGASAFNTRISRETHAAFFEGSVPFVGSGNALPGVEDFILTVSGRYDSYSNVEVEYRDSESGEAGTDTPQDPGAEFTWSVGFSYSPSDQLRIRADTRTSFVAPQLNQLIQATMERSPAAAFRGLYFTEPDSQGRTQTHDNVFNNTGGNDKLEPETAESNSLSVEWSGIEGLTLKAGWSDTVFENRIAYFSSLTDIDPNNLPSNVVYLPDEDIYIRDDRFINVSSIDRSGVDLELDYLLPTERGDFELTFRRSYTTKFKVFVDQASDESQSVLKVKDDVTASRDALLGVVPEHSTYAQLTWRRGGLSVSADAQASSDTFRIRAGGTDGYVYRTDPATIVDLVVVYEFGQDTLFNAPSWMDDLRATLTVNNVADAFTQNSQINRGLSPTDPEYTEVYTINPVYEWSQGRAFRLSISKQLSF